MEMLHPGGGMPAAKPTSPAANERAANLHPVPVRATFIRPDHIPHNPEHHVGRIGDRYHHAPFMFARDGHRFYRRYYLQDGHWFWYDEPALVVQRGDDTQALPTCDANSDECQGDIAPLAEPPPDSGAASGGAVAAPGQQ